MPKKGVGRALYEALEEISRQQNILALDACIAAPHLDEGAIASADSYLNDNSMQFHRHMGYALIGRFQKCGYKFGNWYDMVWMEKELAQRPQEPAPIIPFCETEFYKSLN